MRLRTCLLGLTASCILCSAALAENEAAAREFANGKALLAKADLQGALTAFKAAVKADPENNEYFQHYGLLQRVMKLRTAISEEKDAATWQQMARALCSFYRQYKLYGEALPLARGLHEKAGTGESAELLAGTLIALDKNEDAVTFLTSLNADQVTRPTTTLKGLALAHLGKLDEAKAVAARLEIPKDGSAELCLDAARLYGLLGDSEKATGLLTRAFETTPSSQLDTVKADVKTCPDFARLAATPEFAKALETKSQVAGCGSKAACGKCPLKDKGACGEKAKEGGATDAKGTGCEQHKQAGKE